MVFIFFRCFNVIFMHLLSYLLSRSEYDVFTFLSMQIIIQVRTFEFDGAQRKWKMRKKRMFT